MERAAERPNDILESGRGVSVGRAVLVGASVALLGSLTLGVIEAAIAAWGTARQLDGENLPTGLVFAAVGRDSVTHLLLWAPLFCVLAPLLARMLGRRAGETLAPALAACFVVFGGSVVALADIDEAGWASTSTIFGVFVAVIVAALTDYFTLRWFWRGGRGVRMTRLMYNAAGLCAALLVVFSVILAAGPMFHPANWRSPAAKAEAGVTGPPNVLWIVLDTVRPDRMSCHGYERPTTPFLDEFDKTALVCDAAVSDGTWTVPAHASMFTGLSVREHGTRHGHLRLDDSFHTVADVLSERGYATASFSGNPLLSPETNLTKGFQTHRIVFHLIGMNDFSLGYLWEKLGARPWLPWLDTDLGAAETNTLVGRWLDAHADKPKFVFVNYLEAHLPYLAPIRYRRMFMNDAQLKRSYELRRREFGDLFNRLDLDFNIDGGEFLNEADRDVLRRQYDAVIRYLDDRVRELVGMFEQRGLLDNTLVVIVSDHGEYLGQHGQWGHRFLTYQDLAHVTIQVHEPGRRTGERLEDRVQLSDLYSLVVERKPLQATPDRAAICEYSGPAAETLRRIEGKTDPAVIHRAQPQIAAVGERYKLIRSADGLVELYDLNDDPGELHNLVGTFPDEVKRLQAYIDDWLERTPEYKPETDGDVSPKLRDALRSLGYLSDK